MEDNNNVKLSEKIALNIKKKIFLNRFLLFILVLVILALFIFLTLLLTKVHLPEYDLTENKIYTLSEDSKNALKDIEKPIMIYAYGFEGVNNQMENFLRQYSKVTDKISYKMITDESDPNIVQKNQLSYGYVVLIFESEDSSKLVDAAHELSTYDYNTGESLDIAEQVITNTILDFQLEEKPKVYFTTGHDEMGVEDDLMYLNSFLHNESFETDTINLAMVGSIPEDCDCLAIMSPTVDFFEKEVDVVISYLENGGSIFVAEDTLPPGVELTNFNKILEFYGAGIENGYVIELDENYGLTKSPWIFMPQANPEDNITKEISSESRTFTTFSTRILNDESKMLENSVSYTPLLQTTDQGVFITDLNSDITSALDTASTGVMEICGRYARQVGINEDNTSKNSQMVLLGCGRMVSSSLVLEDINPNTPIVGLDSNRDVVINSLADLTKKDAGLKIRKNMSSATYNPTQTEHKLVLLSTFGIPIIIIILGFVIWRERNKRK